jgi:hypothetical protein
MFWEKWKISMKYITVKVILLLVFFMEPLKAEGLKNTKNELSSGTSVTLVVPIDKQMHFIAGAGISRLISVSTGSLLIGFIISTTIGGVKELIDQRTNGTPDFNDFLATSIGALFVLPFI